MASGGAEPSPQARVDAYFTERSGYWRELYNAADVDGAIFRARQDRAVEWIGQVAEPGARVLDVGCGAGLLTVELAARGYRVEAVDSSEGMVADLRGRASSLPAEVMANITVSQADVLRLPFADDAFDVVVALGVVPWLEEPGEALREIRRVVRPGGHAVITSDNRRRLAHLFDPLWNPWLAGAKRATASAVRRARLSPRRSTAVDEPTERRYSPAQFDAMLTSAAMTIVDRTTVGFGRFTVWNRRLVADPRGVRIHAFLQRRADAGGWLAARGNHDMGLVQKAP